LSSWYDYAYIAFAGQVIVNGFSLWVGLGAVLGLWRVARCAPKRQAEAWVDAGLLVLFAALMGARLFYVGLNWPYFNLHWEEIPRVWAGGLAWPGAFAGGGLAYLLLVFITRSIEPRFNGPRQVGWIPFGWIGDRLYPLLPPLAVTTWLGLWQTGVGYGASVPAGAWWGVPSLDETGVYSLRFPVQALAALSLLAFMGLLELKVKPLHPEGRLSGLAAMGLLLHILIFSLLCAGPAPYWQGMRTDTWFAAFYLALFVTIFIFNNLLFRVWKRLPLSNPERFSP